MFSFVDDNGKVVNQLSYSQFDSYTLNLALTLLAPTEAGGFGVGPGQFAILVYPPGLEFIAAFVACLRAGVIPVQ